MSSKSKPTTPSSQRRFYPEDNENSRIPMPVPSPGPFRRSSSMRLRGERERISGHFPVITESQSPLKQGPNCGASDNETRSRSLSLSLQPNSVHKSRSPRTPLCPATSSTPVGFRHVPRTPPVTPDSPENGYIDDDVDSLHSYSSVASAASCDHAYVARNGTTFSGRKMKYVVHCSSHAGQTGDEYLTPTQRAQRHIRRLKALLCQARQDLEQKDSDIFRLTKEVVELRLYKASLCSPEERSNSSDAVTVRENTADDIQTPDSPLADLTDDGRVKSCALSSTVDFKTHHGGIDKLHVSDMQSSFADSGNFEDITTSSIHSKDSFNVPMHDKACNTVVEDKDEERKRLINLYESKIEELTRRNDVQAQDLKRTHNDRVEALLQKLSDVNSRYCELVPDYEQAKERIRELEKQLEDVMKQLEEQEEKQKKMYLQMYTKGQEAAKIEHADRVLEFAHAAPSRVSVPELLQQLTVTQNELDNIRAMYRRIVEAQGNKNHIDPEVTLQFLKSAIYYFLTDKENHQGHLSAIESILGFSDAEKLNIDKARANK